MALRQTGFQYALKDTFVREKIKEIIADYGIDTIVETGVHKGESSLVFSFLVPNVYGIDILQESIDHARNYVNNFHKRDNVNFIVGNSPDVLAELMPNLNVDKTLFFLDAHWWEHWPINDEISVIEKNKGVIVVHDIFVPDHPEFGYDSYNDQRFDYEFIKDSLSNWAPNHYIEYNTKSFSQIRGVGFIYANKKPSLHFKAKKFIEIEIL